MSQFDVHANRGRHRDRIPYVVVVQSSQFDGYRRRVVVPLVRLPPGERVKLQAFNPTFTVRGTRVVLHPLEIVSIPLEQLGPTVGTLSARGEDIINALDELLSRAWR